MASKEPLLELSDVDSYYDRSHILYDVSMTVPEDSIVTLIGRNGAGKSTTLKSIVGIVKPSSGSITLDGDDITAADPHETARRGIAFVPETRRVFPHLTVEENLQLGSLGHDVADREDRLEEIFDYFPRLQERLNQQAGQLSGGEQQMLSLGRALISDPDLLLVDEPTEGLMPAIVDTLRSVLLQINETGTTILLVEQNVELALEISDYAYVIDEGSIRTSGDSATIANDQDVKSRYLSV